MNNISINLYHGDCLDVLENIPPNSVDLILADPPYGTTQCQWDVVIDLEKMWEKLHKVLKPNKTIILFGQEPFSSLLRCSNLKEFKYDWYWKKTRPSGFTNAKLKPLKDIEIISVFSSGKTANGSSNNMIYNPQNLVKIEKKWSRPKLYEEGDKGVNPTRKNHKLVRTIEYTNYPRQILEYSNPNHNNLHPTQKPIELLEYLIKTHSNEGDVVLDFTMGSGSTGVASIKCKRNFIGIELDEKYYEISKNRIEKYKEECL